MTQLQDLAKPFEQRFIEQKGNHGSYVSHDVITQKLLATLGPFDFAITEIIRSGDNNQVEAIVCRLTCTIDGRLVTVEEVGDCENPSNWKTEGARLKDAASDGIKRCAMRLGCGLHLWAQENYILDKALESRNEAGGTASSDAPPSATVGGGEEKEDGSTEGVWGSAASSGPDSAPASSGSSLSDAILNSVDAGLVKINDVLRHANHLALEAKCIPSSGLSRNNLSELPADVLQQLAQELNISQEAMAL